jgi:hypothetical protein
MALMLTLELRRKPLTSRLGSLLTCVQTGQEDHTPGAPDVTRLHLTLGLDDLHRHFPTLELGAGVSCIPFARSKILAPSSVSAISIAASMEEGEILRSLDAD